MGDGQEQEERLREVFESFDASGCGSLTPEELADLCRSLQLEDATPALLQALLPDQDRPTARVHFQQFKNALIQVLYSAFPGAQEEQEAPPPSVSPEIQPKFVKGSKRYGRRSTPEFLEPSSGIPDLPDTNPAEGALEDNDDSAVPRKRERWNSQESSSEEFEAEGQMHLWNPDGPSTPRGSGAPLSARLEAELRHACEERGVAWDGRAARSELLVLCEHLGLEVGADALLDPDGQTDVQEFVSRLVTRQQPPTPSASTPYRQLKRHHSTQSFDEGGRRMLAFCSGVATPLFSWLDDGTGHAAAESVLSAWMDEGVENGVEILQVLDLELDGKLNLADLTAALEGELESAVLQASLASFRAEIRHLRENMEQEVREKEKIRSDLEKAERQRTQLASEVDERHAAIERLNSLNLRKLEQQHQEKLVSVRSELMKEAEQIQQHAALLREEAEAELARVKEEESLLRDHLSISLKENRRLETELLDGVEKLEEAQSQIQKLQRSLQNLTREKFGELEPGGADLFLQEERLLQLRRGYEAQCRELQDRIDELQAELQDGHALSKGHAHPHKALSEELDSQSPGMESDPGIGSEEVQPFSMSLEAEMMLERLKEQHLLQVEELQHQLEVKVNEFNRRLEEQQEVHEEQEASLSLQYQQELGALQEEMLSLQNQVQQLQNQHVEAKPAAGGEEEEQLRQQLREALRVSADREEQLKEDKLQLLREMQELKQQHAEEIRKLKEEQAEEKVELERRQAAGREQEKGALEERHENLLRVRLEEVKLKFEEEKGELVRRLTEEWEEEKARLDQQRNDTLQELLEEEMLRLVREQEEKEGSLRESWQRERAQLEERHEEVLRRRIVELQEQSEQKERRLREAWEEDCEGLRREKERMEKEAAEEKERHREAVKELSVKHGEERSALSGELQRLRDAVVLERSEAGRLAQENRALRKRISALKEGDLSQEELLQTLERLQEEQRAAQTAGESFSVQSRQLQDENGILTEQTTQRAGLLAEGSARVAACVAALEAELTKALEDTAQLENRNLQLSQQLCELQQESARMEVMESRLSQVLAERQNADAERAVLQNQLTKAQDKVKAVEENLHAAMRQSTRLKAELKGSQQEKDSLKREVALLKKKLLHVQENRALEAAPPAGGRKEAARLREQEQRLLRQENEHLQADAHGLRTELLQAREKIHQLTLSRHKPSALKALEQENAALKRELQAQREQDGGAASSSALQDLHLENEALKAQMSRLSSQLLESFQAQLVGLLPPSPHRVQRGHRDEDPENLQEERKMRAMEERMKEIELSLRNVKLLLREKVSQLKEQLHKNGKADVLIKDLYVENVQLVKALEITEQRQKIAEKKNYLLEEKISSLNKIVRDLSPPPLPAPLYSYQ